MINLGPKWVTQMKTVVCLCDPLLHLVLWQKWEKKKKKLAVFRSRPTGINKPNERTGAQPDIFQGRGGFVKLGHFDTHFIKNSIRKGPAGKIWEFFLLDTLKTIF